MMSGRRALEYPFTTCSHSLQIKEVALLSSDFQNSNQLINRLKPKKGKVESRLVPSLASLKQQIMVNPDVTTSHLIGMKSPTILLPFLDCFADVLVVLNFRAFVFFQLTSPL